MPLLASCDTMSSTPWYDTSPACTNAEARDTSAHDKHSQDLLSCETGDTADWYEASVIPVTACGQCSLGFDCDVSTPALMASAVRI